MVFIQVPMLNRKNFVAFAGLAGLLGSAFLPTCATFGAEAAIKPDQIRSSDAKQRNLALNAIETQRATNYLSDVEAAAKSDPDRTVRHNAIGVLARMGGGQEKMELVKIASHAKDVSDRQVAVSALPLVLNRQEALPVLKQALNDSDEIVRIRAAGSLGRLGDTSGEKVLLNAANSTDTRTWTEAMRAVGYVNTSAVRTRLQQLAKGNYRGNYEAKAALRRLEYSGASPATQFEMATQDISSPYQDIVYLGCEKLADLGTPEATQYLFKVANDLAHESFRAARDVLVSKRLISLSDYGNRVVTPK